MKSLTSFAVVAVTALLGFSGRQAVAGEPDAWITTRARIALLTTDGAGRTAVKVDTENGRVTLHGTVGSEAQRQAAGAAVESLDGVKSVRNLVQVVPEAWKAAVKASDAETKDAVEAALKSRKALHGVKVESVDDGVVLLEGSTTTLALKLEAIEAAYDCAGVRHVASKIEAREK